MSNDIQKEKHSKRMHRTESKVKSRVKVAERFGQLKALRNQSHRFAKLHPLDCGNSNCVMCGNPRKFWKQETIQEQSAKQDKIQEE